MKLKNEYLGSWWIAEEDNNKIDGVLEIGSNGEISLKLIGSFEYNRGDLKGFFNIDGHSRLIYGETSCGVYVTLISCIFSSKKMHSPGSGEEVYYVNQMIIGGKLLDPAEIYFKKFKMRCDLLEEWVNKRILLRNDEENSQYHFNLAKPEILEFGYGPNRLRIIDNILLTGNNCKSITIRNEMYIELETEANIDISKGINLANEISSLISIAGFSTVSLLAFEFEIDEYDYQLYFKSILKNREIDMEHKNTNGNRMLFQFTDVINSQSLLDKWFSLHEEIKPILMYLSELNRKEVFDQMKFLKIMQSIEAFSRRMRNNSLEDKNIFNERLNSVLSNIENSDNRNWVEESLAYKNEPSLRKRLKELLDETDFLFRMNSKTKSKVINSAVEIRNYLTHFDKKKEKNLEEFSKDMFYIGKLFMYTLQALVLLELGFDNSFIIRKLNQNNNISVISKKISET